MWLDFILITLLLVAIIYILALEKQRRVIISSYPYLVLAAKNKKSTEKIIAEFLNNLEWMQIRDYNVIVKLLGKLTNTPIKKQEYSLTPVSSERVAEKLSAMINEDIKYIEHRKLQHPRS